MRDGWSWLRDRKRLGRRRALYLWILQERKFAIPAALSVSIPTLPFWSPNSTYVRKDWTPVGVWPVKKNLVNTSARNGGAGPPRKKNGELAFVGAAGQPYVVVEGSFLSFQGDTAAAAASGTDRSTVRRAMGDQGREDLVCKR